jgi:SAM-dependent methyltransferase
VLDVGGGTGVHAEWLAAEGYDVELVDPVPLHVEEAAKLPGVIARQGDARALPVPDGQADAVLLLGPLYHLPERADRLRALSEARRAARHPPDQNQPRCRAICSRPRCRAASASCGDWS